MRLNMRQCNSGGAAEYAAPTNTWANSTMEQHCSLGIAMELLSIFGHTALRRKSYFARMFMYHYMSCSQSLHPLCPPPSYLLGGMRAKQRVLHKLGSIQCDPKLKCSDATATGVRENIFTYNEPQRI